MVNSAQEMHKLYKLKSLAPNVETYFFSLCTLIKLDSCPNIMTAYRQIFCVSVFGRISRYVPCYAI